MSTVSDSVVRLSFILFRECLSKWGISFYKMAELIKNFNLVSYIVKNEFFLNHYGKETCVDEIEKYIIEKGGGFKEFGRCQI